MYLFRRRLRFGKKMYYSLDYGGLGSHSRLYLGYFGSSSEIRIAGIVCCVGFFVMTVSLVLDVLGDQLGIWHYRFNVLPVLPSYFPWDITLMPVTIMFFSQVKPHVNPIIKAVLFTLLTSYISEPFIS